MKKHFEELDKGIEQEPLVYSKEISKKQAKINKENEEYKKLLENYNLREKERIKNIKKKLKEQNNLLT